MLLKEKRYYSEEWNKKIMPEIGKSIKERTNLQSDGFMVYGQTMESILEENGKLFKVIGWYRPDGKSYVDCKKFNNGEIKNEN